MNVALVVVFVGVFTAWFVTKPNDRSWWGEDQ